MKERKQGRSWLPLQRSFWTIVPTLFLASWIYCELIFTLTLEQFRLNPRERKEESSWCMSQSVKRFSVKFHQAELHLGKKSVSLVEHESCSPLRKRDTVPHSNLMYCSCCRRPRDNLPVTDALRLFPVKCVLNRSWKSKDKTFHKNVHYLRKKKNGFWTILSPRLLLQESLLML